VPLCCQQELNTQRFLGVPTGKNPEDSNLAIMEAMQWALVYLSVLIGVIENISHSTANRSRQYSFSYKSEIKCFGTHVDMDIFLVLVCGNRAQSLSAPFLYTLYSMVGWLVFNAALCFEPQRVSVFVTFSIRTQ
jgi:hypothetical protein